jgi:SAM-dependent methyltransferase
MAAAETAKYERIWGYEEYAVCSPGEDLVEAFLEIARPAPGASVIELGCGTARAGLALRSAGLAVTLLDLTDAGLDPAARVELADKLIKAPLWGHWPGDYDFGYCVDVMEHIPPEYTMLVLDRIMARCRRAFFQICLIQDGFGRLIGEPLHLTVMPFQWWRDRLAEFGTLTEARDLIKNGLFYVER